MNIYNYDDTGLLLGTSQADMSPLEHGTWLIPARATDLEPPVTAEGERARFVAGAWQVEPIPVMPLHEPDPEPTPADIEATLVAAVQRHLDEAAIAKRYDSILSACSYAAVPNPFQAESQAFLSWRGAVWAHCYEVLAACQAGDLEIPTEADLISELPALELP